MSIRNQNWYNLQATRRYPIDENSLGVDDAGAFIRDDILVDCHIRFPNNIGKYVYVQGLTVSAGIVTVLFGVAEEINNTGGPTIAVVSLPKPVEPNVNYPVTAIVPGVTGWVVFGPGVDADFVGRYTAPSQSAVAPRCARSYRPLPIPTIGKLGLQNALDGIINLAGDLPVKVRYDETAGRAVRMVNGEKVVINENIPAIIVELDRSQITENYNPLQQFLGPCGQRPESGTCPKTPIENINGITPDCAGNIDIVFENMDAQLFAGCGGVDVIANVAIENVCDATTPVRQFQDECCAADVEVANEAALANIPADIRVAGLVAKVLDTNNRFRLNNDLTTWTAAESEEYCAWPDPTDKIPDIIEEELPPEPAYPCATLPVCADFNSCDGSAPAFVTRYGTFLAATIPAPALCPHCTTETPTQEELIAGSNTLTPHNTYASTNNSGINIATFKNCATDWSIGKTIGAELRIGTLGIERNGGLVLNFRRYLSDLSLVQTAYVAVVLDAGRGQLRVLRFTNNAVTVESSVNMRVKVGAWYRLSATPNINGNSVALNVYAEEMTQTNPATASLTLNISNTNYGDLVGAAGLFSSRSYTYFNKFTITE